jgi:hypothetical protein
VASGGPTVIQGYSIEYPNFLAKKIIYIVYTCKYIGKKKRKYIQTGYPVAQNNMFLLLSSP